MTSVLAARAKTPSPTLTARRPSATAASFIPLGLSTIQLEVAWAATNMDKTLNYLLKGAFNVMKSPILFFLIVGIVISLVRHPPGRVSDYASKKPIKS